MFHQGSWDKLKKQIAHGSSALFGTHQGDAQVLEQSIHWPTGHLGKQHPSTRWRIFIKLWTFGDRNLKPPIFTAFLQLCSYSGKGHMECLHGNWTLYMAEWDKCRKWNVNQPWKSGRLCWSCWSSTYSKVRTLFKSAGHSPLSSLSPLNSAEQSEICLEQGLQLDAYTFCSRYMQTSFTRKSFVHPWWMTSAIHLATSHLATTSSHQTECSRLLSIWSTDALIDGRDFDTLELSHSFLW